MDFDIGIRLTYGEQEVILANRKAIIVRASIVAALISVALLWLVPGRVPLNNQNASPETQKEHKVMQPERPPAAASKDQQKATYSVPPKRIDNAPTMPGADRYIIPKLEEQGVSARNASRLVRKDYVIPDQVFERLSKASNWMPELAKAASSTIIGKSGKPTMLRIYDVSNDSVLREIGIQDGDVVALINGEIPVFDPSGVVEYTQEAYSFINDLENGKPVSVTILRDGRPINLVYQR